MSPTQNQDGWVSFDVRNGLDAHVPAIADANIDVSAENVTLDTDQLNTQATEGYYLKANRMYSVSGTLNLCPYRASFTFPQPVRGFDFNLPTGIRQLLDDAADNAVQAYDLSGRRTSRTQRGVVITQGKKKIVK